jgi:hypothetical protein
MGHFGKYYEFGQRFLQKMKFLFYFIFASALQVGKALELGIPKKLVPFNFTLGVHLFWETSFLGHYLTIF